MSTAIAKDDPYKVFNDPIHGHIELHPLCVKIIDTPQFQRLRFLKQLGAVYFVYPGAAHNRFEHCIGVCHLAGQLARSLQRRQPGLGITEKDILCVEIAGLCHDLGHGPFSHMFDKFIREVRPDKSNWKHEKASVTMLDYLVENNNLKGDFERHGLYDTHVVLIKELIFGSTSDNQIVANKRNGIDVDKWDYFARDCHMLGIRNNFDHNRCMAFARVINVDGDLQICFRNKEFLNLHEMFHTRMTLHWRAYQHRVNNIIQIIEMVWHAIKPGLTTPLDLFCPAPVQSRDNTTIVLIYTLIAEAFRKADEYMKIPGKNGKMYKISETIDDMEAYTKLHDDIFYQILLSSDPNLRDAKEILNKILKRQLYKFVCQVRCEGEKRPEAGEILKCSTVESTDESKILDAEDLIVDVVFLDYGMKNENPMDSVRFYNKMNPTKAFIMHRDEVSKLLPEKFAEQHIRLYCKKTDQDSLDFASKCFESWCKKQGFSMSKEDVE